MHNQVLVIYPSDVELDDIMYWYQEIDKTQDDKMNDERCQFLLTFKEEEIPKILNDIELHLKKYYNKYLSIMQYRSDHSLSETIKKYDKFAEGCYSSYKYYYDKLEEFEQIKNLPNTHPRKIKFIKEHTDFATDLWADIYIKGKGYGSFHNPYEIWDYYTIVNKHRFPPSVNFLVDKTRNIKDNHMPLNILGVNETVDNILEFTRVWEYIIFCEKDPKNSRLYTIDDIRFGDSWNEHCRVDNLKTVLQEIYDKYCDDDYMVTALDFHW